MRIVQEETHPSSLTSRIHPLPCHLLACHQPTVSATNHAPCNQSPTPTTCSNMSVGYLHHRPCPAQFRRQAISIESHLPTDTTNNSLGDS
ncbi:hypothetical protein CGRA01v4_00019 [Colletotrichum graminicola]|nr:hypothetical protein CGRA01v4_00019 [Colletotrichum graminicola]